MRDTRPLHLIVIDGWHPALLQQERDRLPAFSFLAAAGALDLECVSTFPTVTPSALSTLVTGAMPSAHGIRGIMWYHREEDRYVHYWPSHQSLVMGTMPRVLRDIFVHLNGAHLSAATPTVFEVLEGAGLVCGNVNFPITRGACLHRATLPWPICWLAGMAPDLAVSGPRHCYLGDFVPMRGFGRQGLFGRFGINDDRAGDYGAAMIKRLRPDFSLVYLNEHDLRSHHAGPMGCAYSLSIIDRQLAKLMDAYGSWEKAISEARWILVGDHAQSPIGGVPGYAVNVLKAFKGLMVAPLAVGGLSARSADLAIAPNDRSALIYLRDPGRLADVLEQVALWPSVDQIAWREGGGYCAMSAGSARVVRWREGGARRDPHGRAWDLSGDPAVLDVRLPALGRIDYREYPDALSRLADALDGGADVVITARRGYEFTTGFTMGKGNHGSLAKEDSMVPLLTVGLPPLMAPARTSDVAHLVLAAFGLASSPIAPFWRQKWSSSVSG
ncbi:MAG TPA: alkaline phosphatase family protein [Pantanalinema sp.]